MEYQSQNGNGQLEWYTLIGDSTIPEKVRFKNFKRAVLKHIIYHILSVGVNSFFVDRLISFFNFRGDVLMRTNYV